MCGSSNPALEMPQANALLPEPSVIFKKMYTVAWRQGRLNGYLNRCGKRYLVILEEPGQ